MLCWCKHLLKSFILPPPCYYIRKLLRVWLELKNRAFTFLENVPGKCKCKWTANVIWAVEGLYLLIVPLAHFFHSCLSVIYDTPHRTQQAEKLALLCGKLMTLCNFWKSYDRIMNRVVWTVKEEFWPDLEVLEEHIKEILNFISCT